MREVGRRRVRSSLFAAHEWEPLSGTRLPPLGPWPRRVRRRTRPGRSCEGHVRGGVGVGQVGGDHVDAQPGVAFEQGGAQRLDIEGVIAAVAASVSPVATMATYCTAAIPPPSVMAWTSRCAVSGSVATIVPRRPGLIGPGEHHPVRAPLARRSASSPFAPSPQARQHDVGGRGADGSGRAQFIVAAGQPATDERRRWIELPPHCRSPGYL